MTFFYIFRCQDFQFIFLFLSLTKTTLQIKFIVLQIRQIVQQQMGSCCYKPSKKSLDPDQNHPTSQSILHNTCGEQKYVSNLAFVRIQGNDTRQLLHRSIMALRFKHPYIKNSFIHGSGVLLSNDLVLTVAHNLYEKTDDIQFQKKDFQVFEVVDGVAEVAHEVEDWRYMPEFKSCQISNKLPFDYALIKLKPSHIRPIFYDKFLDLVPPCKCVRNKDPQIKLEIYGYPQYNKNYEPMNKQLTKLKLFQYGLTLPDSILEVSRSKFKIAYAVSTQSGQSGCPVVVGNQIIAIHTGSNKKKSENCNIGRMITSDLIKNVEKWRIELGGSPISLSQKPFCPHHDMKSEEPREDMEEESQIVRELYPYYSQRQSSFQTSNSRIADAIYFEQNANKLKEEYKYNMALKQYMKSIAIYEQLIGKDSTEVAVILIYGIGHIYGSQGKYIASLDAYERGKTILQKKSGERDGNNYHIAVSYHRMGWIYYLMSEYDQALSNYQMALSITYKIKGNESVEVGGTFGNIGLVYWKKENYTLALQYLKRSLKIKEKAGKAISMGAAKTYNNIGAVYDDQKKYQLALENYHKALTIKKINKGDESVEVALTMMNIGLVYFSQGNCPRAIDTYKQTIVIFEKHQLKHRDYAKVHLNLGNAYLQMKDYSSAATALRIALPIFEEIGLTADVQDSSLCLVRCLSFLEENEEMEKIAKKYSIEINDF